MDKRIKKVRPQSCNSESGKRKTFTVKSVTHNAEKVKCVVATKELNAYQKNLLCEPRKAQPCV